MKNAPGFRSLILAAGIFIASCIPAAAVPKCVTQDQNRSIILKENSGSNIWFGYRFAGDTIVMYAYLPNATFGIIAIFHRKCRVALTQVTPFFIRRVMGIPAWNKLHRAPINGRSL